MMIQRDYIPYDAIKVGDSEEIKVTFTEQIVSEFSKLIGDRGSFHVSEESASRTVFKKRIVHGVHILAYVSVVIGEKLPGFGTIYCSQSIEFLKPVYLEETISVQVTILEKLLNRKLRVRTTVYSKDGEMLMDGEAIIKAYA